MPKFSRDEIRAAIEESDLKFEEQEARRRKPRELKVSENELDYVTFNLRVPKKLMTDFEAWCKSHEYNRAQLIRKLMRDHMKRVHEQ